MQPCPCQDTSPEDKGEEAQNLSGGKSLPLPKASTPLYPPGSCSFPQAGAASWPGAAQSQPGDGAEEPWP